MPADFHMHIAAKAYDAYSDHWRYVHKTEDSPMPCCVGAMANQVAEAVIWQIRQRLSDIPHLQITMGKRSHPYIAKEKIEQMLIGL